jgi:hypothetical protein
VILAPGEATGHAHAIREDGAVLYHGKAANGERFLRVLRPVSLTHEEHDKIALEAGIYRVRRQRCRVASRNFVTGCLTEDVTSGQFFSRRLSVSLSRKAEGQSDAAGGRSIGAWFDDHAKPASDAAPSRVSWPISPMSLCTARCLHTLTRRCNV